MPNMFYFGTAKTENSIQSTPNHYQPSVFFIFGDEFDKERCRRYSIPNKSLIFFAERFCVIFINLDQINNLKRLILN